MSHNARAVRMRGPGGVGRGFAAECDCKWRSGASSMADAAHRAAEHNVCSQPLLAFALLYDLHHDLICECYDPASMEYGGDEPCTRCRIVALLEGTAA